MDFIIEFYKSLDMLNLIIFWGVIIVIVLLLILSFILINKNKKLKHLVDTNNKEQEELPIKIENMEENKEQEELQQEEKTIILPPIPENPKETEIIPKSIEKEKKFIAEEHVMEYNKELFSLSNIKKANEMNQENANNEANHKQQIEIPNKPYQRNVLREMSLNQTSPIGLTSPIKKEDKKVKMAKDLEESLNNYEKENIKEDLEKIKNDLTSIENLSPLPRKTEIKDNLKYENEEKQNTPIYQRKKIEEPKRPVSLQKVDIEKNREIFIDITKSIENEKNKNSSEKYLEEVSKKLAEAEVPDGIERTNYELEQEENAIISYKELMEKKDSIQTIDEEDAIISIEELMNRSNQNEENQKELEEETKLYNLTEEEENDNFIKELKQFRSDL